MTEGKKKKRNRERIKGWAAVEKKIIGIQETLKIERQSVGNERRMEK